MSTIIKKQRRRSVALQTLQQKSWFEYKDHIHYLPEQKNASANPELLYCVDLTAGMLCRIDHCVLVLPVTSVTLEIQP